LGAAPFQPSAPALPGPVRRPNRPPKTPPNGPPKHTPDPPLSTPPTRVHEVEVDEDAHRHLAQDHLGAALQEQEAATGTGVGGWGGRGGGEARGEGAVVRGRRRDEGGCARARARSANARPPAHVFSGFHNAINPGCPSCLAL
jgi:hypothetical protein